MKQMDSLQPEEEDLSLQPILQTLWSYRRVMMLAFGAVMLLFTAAMIVMYIVQPKERVASLEVRLTFDGADRGQYPNGTKFSPTEIVSTPVVTTVFQKNDLQRYMTFGDFKDALFVVQSNPDLDLLTYEYQAKLSDSKLGAADRNKLEEEFRSKREAMKVAQYSINLRSSGKAGQLPSAMLDKVLQDVVATWATQAAERKGAVRYNIPVLSNNVISKDFFQTEDFVVAADILRTTIDQTLKTVWDIAALPGAAAARVGQEQATIADLRVHLEDLQRFKVEPLIGTIRSNGLSRNPSRMDEYYADRLFQVQLDREQAEAQVKSLQDALASYQQRTTEGNTAGGDAAKGAVVAPQVSESFIDRLLSLSQQSQDMDYRQKLTNRIIEEGLVVANLRREADYYDSMRKAFAGARRGDGAALSTDVTKRLQDIFENMNRTIDQVQGLYKIIAEQNLNPTLSLYTITNPYMERTIATFTRRSMALYLLLTIAASCILLPLLCLAHAYFRQWISPHLPPPTATVHDRMTV